MIRGEYWWIYYRDTGIDWSHWLAGESVPVRQGSCTNSMEIPAPDGATLVLCINGEAVRIHDVKVPSRNRNRFFASLPYALEDKLLHSPEDYHFVALAKNKALAKVPVAVVSKNILEDILTRFRHHDWQIKLMLPDFLYIAAPPTGTWILDVTETPFLLRVSGSPTGAVLSGELTTQPPGAFILALEQADPLPRRLQVRVNNSEQLQRVEGWAAILETYPITLDVITDVKPRAAWLSRFPLPAMGLNLLTEKFGMNGPALKQLKRYRPAVALGAAILLVMIVQWIIEGSRIESDYYRLQSTIEQTYMDVFPDARNLVDPRFQMEQQLLKLSNARDPSDIQFDFLVSLEQLATILGDNNTQLQRLEFDGTAIVIEISLIDYESLERLQQQLTNAMKISVESAELKNGRVHSRINLEART